MEQLRIDVWSDIACPWCYVGKRRLDTALERFPHRDAVLVVWRAFELDPSAPRVRDTSVPYAVGLSKKYGTSVARAEGMIRHVTDVAAADGVTLRYDRVKGGNTFNAHRVLHLAAKHGVQSAVKERFFRGYMTEGETIGDPEVLVRLAAEAGLDSAEVATALASDAYAREVRADEEEARSSGISGVPFFLLGGRYALSGAQPRDAFLNALTRAWTDVTSASSAAAPGDGAACGPGECA